LILIYRFLAFATETQKTKQCIRFRNYNNKFKNNCILLKWNKNQRVKDPTILEVNHWRKSIWKHKKNICVN